MQLPLSADTAKIDPSSPHAAADSPAAPGTRTTRDSAGGDVAAGDDAQHVETPYKTQRRFDRAARLFGEAGLHHLMHSRVLVIGVGGVGSFAAEALARSGVGHLVLVDFDKVCVTNTNRQLHAMKGTVGKHKVEVMAERLRLIHPTAQVDAEPVFYDASTSRALLSGQIDFVVDAIDNLTAKAHLIAACLERRIPLVSSMGAAARLDPTRVTVDDLSNTMKDPFARAVRKILRDNYGINAQKGQPIGVDAVFSIEEPRAPEALSYDEGVGFRCVCPGGKNGMHDCERRARIDGTASLVTGAFGLAAASSVVRRLLAAQP